MTREQRIKNLVKFLKENYPNTQIFNTPCMTDDYQKKVYLDENSEGDIWVMYAPGWDYCDIYGLTEKEFYTFVAGEHLKKRSN